MNGRVIVEAEGAETTFGVAVRLDRVRTVVAAVGRDHNVVAERALPPLVAEAVAPHAASASNGGRRITWQESNR